MNPFDLQQLQRALDTANSNARRAVETGDATRQTLASVLKQQETLLELVKRLKMERTGGVPNLQYIENVPGRRIPFDYAVSIPIGAGVNAVQPGTITISQDGPFVAVSRYATFLSQYEFQRRDPETEQEVRFQGRSYGRYRPIHSAWDVQDGLLRSQVGQAQAFPGTGAPHALSPSNGSPWRSMEGDYAIQFVEQGSSWPRSNIPVPSTFWTTEINSPFALGCLDFFERGNVLQFQVLPLHVNNPAFGNISAFGAPNANMPFVASGWDYAEGINDENDAAADATDPITRLPNGILTIGFHGYRIIQAAGSGPY